MSGDHKRELGYRDGIRAAVAWLHLRATEMNDPHARAILNTTANDLGAAKDALPTNGGGDD